MTLGPLGVLALLAVVEPSAGEAPPAAAPAAANPGAPAVRVLLWPEMSAPASPAAEDALMVALRSRIPDLVASDSIRHDPAVAAREHADAADLQRLEGIFADARRAYLTFELDAARERIRSLIDGELEPLTRRGQLPFLRRVLRLAAQVDMASGHAAEARGRARTAALLPRDGEAQGGLPPDYLKLESDARADLEALAPRALLVAPDPAGAKVSVDGRDTWSKPPVTLDLVPGEHVVRIEAPGRIPSATLVDVGPGGGTWKPVLAADPGDAVLLRAIARGDVNPLDPPELQALLARAHASHLVTYRSDPSLPNAVAVQVHPKVGPWRDAGSGEPAHSALAQRIADIILGAAGPPNDAPRAARAVAAGPEAPSGEESPPAVWRRGWFWVLVGVGVAAGAAGGILLWPRPDQHATVRPK